MEFSNSGQREQRLTGSNILGLTKLSGLTFGSNAFSMGLTGLTISEGLTSGLTFLVSPLALRSAISFFWYSLRFVGSLIGISINILLAYWLLSQLTIIGIKSF